MTTAAMQTAAAYLEDLGDAGVKTPSSHARNLQQQQQQPAAFDLPLTEKERKRRAERLERFGRNPKGSVDRHDNDNDAMTSSPNKRRRESATDETDAATSTAAFVGTCQDLEKPYLRLTTFPKRENVRPLHVLVRSLQHIKDEFIRNEDFDWANEQLKSVRQDLVVQHIRNRFVLDVYETHARILLEHGDLSEFNQCQSMIVSLTTGTFVAGDDDSDGDAMVGTKDTAVSARQEEGPGGSDGTTEELQQTAETADEFAAYRILYALVQRSGWDLNRAIEQNCAVGHGTETATLQSPATAVGPATRHALRVVRSILHDDFHSFFKLYESAPHLSAFLMDFLVRRVRQSGLERIVAAFRPTVSIEYVREALFLHDLDETRRFLQKSGAVFVKERGGPSFWIDCRATSIATGIGTHRSEGRR